MLIKVYLTDVDKWVYNHKHLSRQERIYKFYNENPFPGYNYCEKDKYFNKIYYIKYRPNLGNGFYDVKVKTPPTIKDNKVIYYDDIIFCYYHKTFHTSSMGIKLSRNKDYNSKIFYPNTILLNIII